MTYYSRAKVVLRSASFLGACGAIALAACWAILFSERAEAQDLPVHVATRETLLNNRALEKALAKHSRRETPRASRRVNRRRSEPRTSRDSGVDFPSSVRLDTVEDVLATSDNDSQFLIASKSIVYLRYFNDVIDIGDIYDENTDEAVAKRMMLIQAVDSMTKYVQKSPLADTYRRVANKLRRVQAYTTVGVSHGEDLKLHYAESVNSDDRIVQFKIHSSARVGIEPRLEMGHNLRLKYNPFERVTALEYGFDF